jgi:hypothetical protein
MHMITEDEPSYHARALYRRLSKRPHRILYVGLDHQLMKYLEDHLDNCWTVRAPSGLIARLFIEQLKHSLFLFDNVLMDTTGRELKQFARKSAYKPCTPIIVIKKPVDLELLARKITRRLTAPQ